jgi:DNA-directed RNA polymerase specialized sigma subunit, sigma24 homolog
MHNTVSLNLDILKPIFDFELFKVKDQDKEDVKQDCIVEILSALPKYSKEQLPDDKLFSFAQVIVKRVVVDYFRRMNRKIVQNSTSVNFCDGVEEDSGAGGADAFSASVKDYGFDITTLRLDYQRNAHRFTPNERRIVELMLFNEDTLGMDVSEAYNALGLHKSHGARALKKLREFCGYRV